MNQFTVIAIQTHKEITDEARYESEGDIECSACGKTGLIAGEYESIDWVNAPFTMTYCIPCVDRMDADEDFAEREYQRVVSLS